MFKVMYEIEIYGNSDSPSYIYIEADEDISVELDESEHGRITHITTIESDIGVTPDLVIKKEEVL